MKDGFEPAQAERTVHIVQISLDDTVFRADAPSDTLARQLHYGRQLDRQRPGSRMTFLALTANAATAPVTVENVTFAPVPARHPFVVPAVVRALLRLDRRQRIDVVSAQTPFEDGWAALLFGRLRQVPAVAQIHFDFLAESRRPHGGLPQRIARRLRFALASWTLPAYDAVRVVGTGVKRMLLEKKLHSRVEVIPVPVTMLADGPLRARALPPAPRVLFVGRLAPEKRLDDWLHIAADVARRNGRAHFDIVGDGECAGRLRSLAGSLGLGERVTFHGALPYARLAERYGAATVFLLTSAYEGFGRVVVEALAHGVPVVAPRIVGVEDIVEHQRNGLLVPPGNPSAMADAVARLLRDDALNRAMGAAGAAAMPLRFGPEALAQRWVEMLGAIAFQAKPRQPRI